MQASARTHSDVLCAAVNKRQTINNAHDYIFFAEKRERPKELDGKVAAQ